MKKLPKIIFLSFLALTVSGCSENLSSSSEHTPSSSSPTISESSTTINPSTNSTTKESQADSSTPSSEKPTSSEIESSQESTSSSSSSSSVDIYETTQWNRATVNLMIKYMDSNIIPFVDLGTYSSEWSDSTSKSSTCLKIYGSDFDSSKMDGFKNTYEQAGWTITKNMSTTLNATKDNLSISITKDSDGFFLLKANYDCPYDETKAPTDWDSDTAQAISDNLNGHTIPYIYLGSPACYASFSDYSKTLTIYGFKFDANIITNAKTKLQADGWTVEDTSNSYGPGITATKNFPDAGDSITLTFSTPYSTSTTRYSFTAKLVELWDDTKVSDWSADMTKDFKATFENHVPDYFYLGSKNPSYTISDSGHYFKITGGLNDARTIPGVKTTLAAKGWTCIDTQGSYGTGLVAKKDLDDSCQFRVEITCPSSASSKIEAYVYFVPKLALPEESKQKWPDEVSGLIDVQLNHHSIPYIYLGDEDVTAQFDTDYAKMRIYTTSSSTFYTPKIVTNAADVFKKDGWSVTSTNGSYGDCIVAEKTFDNGDKIIAKLDSVSATSKAYLYLQLVEAYDANYQSQGSWYTDRAYDNLTGEDTSSTGHSMDTNFDNHKIPYVYIGTKNHNYSYDSSTRKMTVYGGLWNSAFITAAINAFTADNTNKADGDTDWAITTNEAEDAEVTTATNLTAIKTFADGCTLKAVLKKPSEPSDSTPVYATKMEIYYSDSWGSKTNAWDATSLDKMKALNLPAGVSIPYVYLGTDTPTTTSSTYAYQNYLQSLGAVFDDRVLEEFDTAYSAAGFTVEDDITRYGKPSKVAYKEFKDADGNKIGTLRACVYRWSNNDSAKAALRVFYDACPSGTKAAPTYTDDEKKLMKDTLDGTDESILPSVYVGPTYKVSASASNGGYLEIATGTTKECYNYYSVLDAEEAFASAGWNVTKVIFTATGDPTGAAGFKATKATSKGTLTANVTATNSSTSTMSIKVSYSETFAAPSDGTITWSEDLKKAMSDSMDGYVLPYFYLGKKVPLYTTYAATASSNKVLALTGSTWDDSIVSLMKSALNADTLVKDWNIVPDYPEANTYGIKYIATGTYQYKIPAVVDEDGNITTPEQTMTKHITLKLYKDKETNGSRPILEVYYS